MGENEIRQNRLSYVYEFGRGYVDKPSYYITYWPREKKGFCTFNEDAINEFNFIVNSDPNRKLLLLRRSVITTFGFFVVGVEGEPEIMNFNYNTHGERVNTTIDPRTKKSMNIQELDKD